MLKRIIAFAYIFLFLMECVCAQTIITNPIKLERGDNLLITYYLEMRNDGKHSKSLFVLLQGSDFNSVRNNPNVQKIKTVLPDADILTIEKYGITEKLPYSYDIRDSIPKDYIDFDNLFQRVSDVNMVIEALIKNFDYEKIFVFGGSEGALVACLLASKYNYVNATITFGGGSRFFIDDVTHSVKCSPKLSDEEKEKNIEGFKQFSQYILAQDSLEFSMSEHGFLWWKTMLSYDFQEIISNISTPLLILQGGKDNSVSPEKTTEMFQALKQLGKNNIDYLFYPEYDHTLNFSLDDKSVEIVLQDVQKWIQKIINEKNASR